MDIVTLTDEQRQALVNTMSVYRDSLSDEDILESMDCLAMILTELGGGYYDEQRQWRPSLKTVYAFDLEVYGIGQMYALFLQGIMSLGQGELVLQNVVKDQSAVDWQAGTGTIAIDFAYNGLPERLILACQQDWFGLDAIRQMNRLFAERGNPKRRYYLTDGYLECLIFYNTPQWAERFAQCTRHILYGEEV